MSARLRSHFVRFSAAAAVAVVSLASTGAAEELSPEQLTFFESKVRPVLVNHCYECHSTEGKKVKGGLLLDSKAGLLKGGDSGPAIMPREPEKSLLISAVRHADKDLKMPKEKIAEHEIEALTQWVKMGAPDPRSGDVPASPRPAFDWENERKHWAYQPISNPPPPDVRAKAWPRSDIDRFILAGLETKGIRPVADADARTMIRRVNFDLIGLPPSVEEVRSFESEWSVDPQGALGRLVDRLLASPQYGERWGRHWMDLVRYADTAGDNSDYPVPQLWRYRNYVIDAFNQDKPFDAFIREQIAGDLLSATNQEERNRNVVATGYVALSRRFGSVTDRYPQHLTIEDTLDNIGRTFMGLTFTCARCHDHKFDAISQRDYYALYGIFSSTEYAFPGIELLKIQKNFVPLVSKDELEKAMAPFQAKAAELQAAHDKLAAGRNQMEEQKEELEKRIAAADENAKKPLADEVAALNLAIDRQRGKIREAAKAVEDHSKTRPKLPDAYAVQDKEPQDAPIHVKGEPDRPGEKVPRRWLELFGGEPLPVDVAPKTSGRLQLANWIADAKNPLTARVIVNRAWHYHFGAGLVKTPSDFGVRGLPPSNPELLDWLAHRFIHDGWSLKKLHREILLSRTYALSSIAAPPSSSDGITQVSNIAAVDPTAIDPDNRLHWRFNRRRLDAESLRDTMLYLSGDLDSSRLEEPHPFPAPEKWEFTQHHPFRATYPSNRRSVYLMTSRLTAQPYFQTFDGPDRNASSPARDSSVTTVQALYFVNNDFVHEQAERFARRLQGRGDSETERLQHTFLALMARSPSEEETQEMITYLSTAREKLSANGKAADQVERAAWSSLFRALFRTNEFLYID